MPLRARKVVPLVAQALTGSVVGRLVAIDRDGTMRVDFVGVEDAPIPARALAHVQDALVPGAQVFLSFENDDRSRPVILGAVVDRRSSDATPFGVVSSDEERSLTIDVDRLLLTLKRELVVRCGDASVTIRSDGSIVLRGTDLLSRSSGSNRIKGGSVRIN